MATTTNEVESTPEERRVLRPERAALALATELHMRIRHLVGALLLIATPAAAQTTGFPGVNDYTVNGIGSGSTSCNLVPLPPATPVPLTVSASGPGLLVQYVFAISFAGGPSCAPGTIPLPPSPCFPGSPAGFPIHSVDLAFATSSTFSLFAVTGPGGTATTTFFTPPIPLGLFVGTQAFITDPTCGVPVLVASQAYDLFL